MINCKHYVNGFILCYWRSIMEHLFERMEKEVNFQEEYKKVEIMISYEEFYESGFPTTINDMLARNFRQWKKRGAYTSLEELRYQLGFSISKFRTSDSLNSIYIDIEKTDYFLFCEMFFNLVFDLLDLLEKYKELIIHIRYVLDTMSTVADKCGFEIKHIDDKYLVVEKNAVAIEVASAVPELANVILEYNGFLLKGNLERKQELLKKIADAIEPKRQEMNDINKSAVDDFFFLVNNMNIRHNNVDKSDPAKYVKQFAELNDAEKEKWYDSIYEQALYLFILKQSKDRKNRIANFKALLNT